jgi:signal transduction histidine kinase
MNDTTLTLNLDDNEPLTLILGNDEDSAPQQATLRRRMLIVDDEEILVQMLGKLFRSSYEVRTATSGAEGLEILRSGFLPELIIADQRMPSMSGAEFLGRSRTIVPMATRIVLTGYTDVNDIIASINQGNVYRFITKPWNPEELLEAVRLGFEHYNLTTRNEELHDALKKLEELHREQKDLLGIVAHDLKNPIGAVRMIAESLLNNLVPEQREEFYKVIFDSSERALNLITDLLNVESLERGGHDMIISPVNLEPIIGDLIGQYQIAAHAKSITLEWENQDALNALVEEKAFLQVMDNLISNAVKYSPHRKHIRVVSQGLERFSEADIRPSGINPIGATSWIGIAVEDNGLGFTDDDKKHVFGKFARLSAQPTGGESSTGLGLSIVKRYVAAMDGEIWFKSEHGKGTTFYVAFLRAM